MARDLQEFIREMDRYDKEWCLKVSQQVKPDKFEVAALAYKLASAGNAKALLFNNTENLLGEKSEFPLLINAFAQRSGLAVALGLTPEQYGMELTEKTAKCVQEHGTMELISSSEAPCQEVVWPADEIDLRRFPVPMFHEKDAGPFFTMVNIMKSRNKDFYEISFCKNQIYGAKSMSSSANLRFYIRHLARVIKEYEDAYEPAPVILVLGHHPAFYLGSQAGVPYGNNDYLTVSSFLNEPLRVTPSVTWGSDFLVPADSEIIIECELIPGAREKQNPFGEFSGHYQAQRLAPVLEVKAVTHKNNAIFQSVFPSYTDHLNIGAIPREGNLFGTLKRVVPGITAVHLPSWGGSRFSCVIALDKRSASDVQKAAMAVLSTLEDCKMVIAVDSDVDVFNNHEVWWALVTQARFENNGITIIPNAQSFRSWLGTSGAVIDATKPDDPDFPERHRIPREALEKINLIL